MSDVFLDEDDRLPLRSFGTSFSPKAWNMWREICTLILVGCPTPHCYKFSHLFCCLTALPLYSLLSCNQLFHSFDCLSGDSKRENVGPVEGSALCQSFQSRSLKWSTQCGRLHCHDTQESNRPEELFFFKKKGNIYPLLRKKRNGHVSAFNAQKL